MKALVIRQPWAWAIIAGHKRFENRTWATKYRGPLVIVAGRSRESLMSAIAFLRENGIEPPADLVFGAAIGVVDLVGITPPDGLADPFAEGPSCWHLANPCALAVPMPCRGLLRLFDIPLADPRTENPQATAGNRLGISHAGNSARLDENRDRPVLSDPAPAEVVSLDH